MAWIREPWSDLSAETRCLDLIQTKNVHTLYYGESIPFGLNLQPDEVWLTSPSESLLEEIEKLDINVTYSSN